MSDFSDKLKTRLIAYFKNKCGVLLTEERAEEYLASYADLFMLHRDIEGEQEECARAAGSTADTLSAPAKN